MGRARKSKDKATDATAPRAGALCCAAKSRERGQWRVYDCIGPFLLVISKKKAKEKAIHFNSHHASPVLSARVLPMHMFSQSVSLRQLHAGSPPQKKSQQKFLLPFTKRGTYIPHKKGIYRYTQQIPIFIKLPNQKRAKLPAFLPQISPVTHTLRHVRPSQPAPQHQRAGPLPFAVARAPGTVGWPGPLQPGTTAEGHRGEIDRAPGPLREPWLGCLHGGIWMLKHQTWEKKLGLDPQTWEVWKI